MKIERVVITENSTMIDYNYRVGYKVMIRNKKKV